MSFFYDEDNGRYVLENAQIQYPNFSGVETEFNQAGKRNFKVVIDEDLAEELRSQGINNITELRRRDDTEPVRFSVKIGVYPSSEIYLITGKCRQELNLDTCGIIDMEHRKGHVQNGKIDLEFHVSVNTRLAKPTPYLRLDTIVIPVRKSRLLAKYEEYEEEEPFSEEA